MPDENLYRAMAESTDDVKILPGIIGLAHDIREKYHIPPWFPGDCLCLSPIAAGRDGEPGLSHHTGYSEKKEGY